MTKICGCEGCIREAKMEFAGTRLCDKQLQEAVNLELSRVPPREPFGIDTISPGCKVFFLVHGQSNASLAGGCDQPAVGIELWLAAPKNAV
jgi:hypothetical protein